MQVADSGECFQMDWAQSNMYVGQGASYIVRCPQFYTVQRDRPLSLRKFWQGNQHGAEYFRLLTREITPRDDSTNLIVHEPWVALEWVDVFDGRAESTAVKVWFDQSAMD